jgi:PBSX family phage terminase large subunit
MSTDLSIARTRVGAFNQSVMAGSPVVKAEDTEAVKKPKNGFRAYGGAKEMWDLITQGEPQVMIHGPAETGKTVAALHLLDSFCWEHKGLQASLIRKIAADMPGTVIRSFEDKVIHMMPGESKTPDGVSKYGGERPEFYRYPNGSRIWVGGMDHPGKVLSGERDFVLVNQAEELEEDDWETISTRTTGRAGVLRPGRLLGDCNPGPSTHWIMSHVGAGTLKPVKSIHKDNPTLYDPETGYITEQGKLSMEALNKLSGVRYKRLCLGLWVAAEGVVYEDWDPITHANKSKPFAPILYYIAGVDWGLTNPGVIQVWGIDHDDRMYRVHEVYQTGKLVAASKPEDAWWILKAKELKEQYGIRMFVADPSRPDHIEAFELSGLPCVAAYNSVELGIQNVQSRLKIQPDGWPRIITLQGSKPEIDPELLQRHAPTCLEEELEVYAWEKDKEGKAKKEKPVEKDNHACDAMRYAAAYVDSLGENEFMFGGAQ